MGCKHVGLTDLRFTKPAYTPKRQHFDAKSAQNLHILKKSKVLIVKRHQTRICIKNQNNQNLRLYVGLTRIDEFVFVFCFLSICGFGDFSLSTLLFFEYMQVLCAFGIKVFFLVYAGFAHSSQKHAFLASHAGFGEVQVTKPAKGMQF